MISTQEIEEVIAEISQEFELEDEIEDQDIAAEPNEDLGNIVEEFRDDTSDYFSLAAIPIEEWGLISVSPVSLFKDHLWDFTAYPHICAKNARVNFDYTNLLGINLTDSKYAHWLNISKALCFYSIPHFSSSTWIRSYASLASKRSKLLRILDIFNKENLYLGEASSPAYRTINNLSRETILATIESKDSFLIKWELAFTIQFWQKLSEMGLLPAQYSIYQRLIEKSDVSSYWGAYENSSNPFTPIPLDDFAEIINYCLTMVNDYGEDVIWLYQTFYPTMVGAFEHSSRMALRPTGFSSGSREGVEAFRAYKPKLVNGKPWWPIEIKQRVAYSDEFIDYSKVASCIASLIDACCTLILATTGIRRSELSNLKTGCVKRREEGAWLTFTVFKTSVASQGDQKTIPIPDCTAHAIELMENLFAEARQEGKHNYLFSVITRQFFGNKAHGAYAERAVKRVARACGVDDSVHPHRFRKSLAMYMIYQDPRNIDLIRHLFSHASLKMTLRYILSLPGVHSEIRKIVIDQNIALLSEIVEGVLNAKIGGIGGKRVKATIDASSNFKAKLQDNGKETLIQYIESLMDQGIQLLHRTNLAICLKTPSLTEDSPCIGKNERAITKLHPNLYACDPLNCRYAAFLEQDIPALESEIVFHDRISKNGYCSQEQKRFSEKRIKDAFTRLSEIDYAHGNQFMKQFINGKAEST
jgi:hypothetical protein